MLLLATMAVVVASCSVDTELFDAKDHFVAFQKSTFRVKEGDILLVPVVVASTKGSPALTVKTSPKSRTAVLNDAFMIPDTSLEFSEGFGTQYVSVISNDDNDFTGNRTFTLKIASNTLGMPLGAIDSTVITIVDDEHPLNLVLGNYVFSGKDAWDDPFSTNVVTSPVEGDLTQITFPLNNLFAAAPAEYLIHVNVELTNNLIKIKTGQSFDKWTYPCKVFGMDADGKDMPDGSYITGTIDPATGKITMNEYLGLLITAGDYKDYLLVCYAPGSVMTKQ